MKNDSKSKYSVPSDLFFRLKRAREYLDDSYASEIRLDDLARVACISPFHLLRTFRQTFGITPHQYLVRRRIERAGELLQISRSSVTDICFRVGFESPGSFSSLFRKWTGNSPLAYRTRIFLNRPLWIPACYVRSYGVSALSQQK